MMMNEQGQGDTMHPADAISKAIDEISGSNERAVGLALAILNRVDLDNRDANSALGDAIDDLWLAQEDRPEFIGQAIDNLELAMELAERSQR